MERDSLRQEVRQLLLDSVLPGALRDTASCLKALQALDEYPLVLIDIIRQEQEAIVVKMMSATQLKTLTAINVATGAANNYNYDLKENIALQLVDLLSSKPDTLARLLSATLANLIIGEFPPMFNAIARKLLTLLLRGNQDEIRGALLFMHDFSKDNEDFCSLHCYFTIDFIEPLINILQNHLFAIEVRILTIRPMMQILITLRHTEHFHPASSRLCEIFCKYLSEPYNLANNFLLKSELVSEILHLFTTVDNANDFVTNCLVAVGQLMSNCCNELKDMMISNKSLPKDIGEQEPENFPQLIKNMLELIKCISLKPCYTNLIMNSMNEFIYLLYILMAAYTNIDEDLFDENCLKKEIDPTYWSTVRGTCVQILMTFMDKCDDCLLLSVFHTVTQRHISEINLIRSNQNLNDCHYKIIEAIMYSFGLFADVYIEPTMQLRGVVEYWSTMFLNIQTNWYIVARLLWLGSKYSRMLPEALLSQHLLTILTNYNANIKGLRIACIDALGNHLSAIEYHPYKTVFLSFQQQIIERILGLTMRNSSNIAFAELQSLAYFYECIKFDNKFTQFHMCELLTSAFYTYISDSSVVDQVKFLLSKIVMDPNQILTMKTHIFPFVIKCIHSDIKERGLDLLNTIFTYFPGRIDDDICSESFRLGYECVYSSDDSGVVERSLGVMCTMIIKYKDQLRNIQASGGNSLASYLRNLISNILKPSRCREIECPINFSRFTILTIMTFSEYFNEHQSLLKELLSALQHTDTTQKDKIYCCIIFYLFYWRDQRTMKFLQNVPGPDGFSALSYFLNKFQWITVEPWHKFELNAIVMGICSMIQYAGTKDDNTMNVFTVRELEYNIECTGLEKLFLCLVRYFLRERINIQRWEDEQLLEEEILLKDNPICNTNIRAHIVALLEHCKASIAYSNAVKIYIDNNGTDYSELVKHGIKPNNLI